MGQIPWSLIICKVKALSQSFDLSENVHQNDPESSFKIWFHFSRFHIYVFIYDICFSLSDLLHSIWQTLGPSTLLQKTRFHFFLWPSNIPPGFPGGASSKESACQSRRCKRCGFDPWVEKTLWSRKWQPSPVFLPRESHEQKSLVGYSPWGCRKSDTTEWVNTQYAIVYMYYISFIHSSKQIHSYYWVIEETSVRNLRVPFW